LPAALTRLRKLLGERRAVTAVEMAIVGPIFLFALIGLFEWGYLFAVQLLVDEAAQTVARQIQTGQAAGSTTWAAFSPAVVCAKLPLLPCSSTNPMINLQSVPVTTSAFGPTSQFALPVTGNPAQLNTASGFNFCNAMPGELIQVNVVYMAPVFFAYWLPQTIGGQFPITSAAAFGDENWPSTGSVSGGC
jgi:Flp pilus assembly protein TadG